MSFFCSLTRRALSMACFMTAVSDFVINSLISSRRFFVSCIIVRGLLVTSCTILLKPHSRFILDSMDYMYYLLVDVSTRSSILPCTRSTFFVITDECGLPARDRSHTKLCLRNRPTKRWIIEIDGYLRYLIADFGNKIPPLSYAALLYNFAYLISQVLIAYY